MLTTLLMLVVITASRFEVGGSRRAMAVSFRARELIGWRDEIGEA